MNIGILGGGQLSRMLALSGYPLGLTFTFLEPNAQSCAGALGHLIHAHYEDHQALLKLAKESNVITYENENIPLTTLEFLLAHQPVAPGVEALKISQDRLFEKNLFAELNIKTAPFIQVDSFADLKNIKNELTYPLFLKKRRQGYDGKGQVILKSDADLLQMEGSTFCQDAIVEQGVSFEREVSLIAVKSHSNEVKFYDISENIHKDGILIQTQNKPNDPIFSIAKAYLSSILERLNYVGVLCVEFFQQGDTLIANEMAPRVHNSGHWTIEGAVTSQFENHLRAILDWPLGETRSIGRATMQNLLGIIPDKKTLLTDPLLHLHDYHKEAKAGRKLGHTTKVDFD